MDNLEAMFKCQKDLQNSLGYDFTKMSVEERVNYIKEYVLHMEHEAHEMLQELPHFKAWKRYSSDPAQQALMLEEARKEWADVTHFFINVSLALGFNAEHLMWFFLDKNALNHTRQQNTADYKKCVGGLE